MTKDEVIVRFCSLASKVRSRFTPSIPADCFCGQPKDDLDHAFFRAIGMGYFRFDEQVMTFIEGAVTKALTESADVERVR